MAEVTDLAEDTGVSIALTPVQLFAMLNGKSISQGELASNTWHEMPLPPQLGVERFLGTTLPMHGLAPMEMQTSPRSARMNAWSAQTHYSQPTPPGCWIPPHVGPPDPKTTNRAMAVIQIVGGGFEVLGGALLLLAPEPTMLTKVGGTVLAAHGVDTTQAAIRQLFSGRPVADFTQTGATWAAREAGTSAKTAHRIGVILDVAVPVTVSVGMIAERVIAIRAGRVILSEEAAYGKAGHISLAEEEADKAAVKRAVMLSTDTLTYPRTIFAPGR